MLNIHCKLSPEACSRAYDLDFDLSGTSWLFSVGLYKKAGMLNPVDDGIDLLSRSTVDVADYMSWSSSIMKKYVGK